jgi:hypothetical protein
MDHRVPKPHLPISCDEGWEGHSTGLSPNCIPVLGSCSSKVRTAFDVVPSVLHGTLNEEHVLQHMGDGAIYDA